MRNEQHNTAEKAGGGRWAKFWDTLRLALGALCV